MSHTKRRHLNIPRGTVMLPPRSTPYALGTAAGNAVAGLRGMPYGPGERQAAYIQGYFDALHAAVRAESRQPQDVVAGVPT